MENDIASAYKRKEWGWFIFYIVAIIWSLQIAGLAGLVGGIILPDLLYRIFKNKSYSKTKQILLSIGSSVAVIAVVVVISFGIKFVLANYFNLRATSAPAQQILNSTTTFQTNNSNTNEKVATSSATVLSTKLQASAYTSNENNFSIIPPKNWKIDTQDPNFVATFVGPDEMNPASEAIAVDQGIGSFTLKQYAAGGIQGIINDSLGGDSSKLKVVSQNQITINGQSAYQVEYTFVIATNGQSYLLHGEDVFLIHNGLGYRIVLMALDSSWSTYKDTFSQSVSTFNFLK